MKDGMNMYERCNCSCVKFLIQQGRVANTLSKAQLRAELLQKTVGVFNRKAEELPPGKGDFLPADGKICSRNVKEVKSKTQKRKEKLMSNSKIAPD
jgi:hypothetical protein